MRKTFNFVEHKYKKYNSVGKKQKEKYGKTLMLAKSKLNSIEISISKALRIHVLPTRNLFQ